jgi:hypothetical protein
MPEEEEEKEGRNLQPTQIPVVTKLSPKLSPLFFKPKNLNFSEESP